MNENTPLLDSSSHDQNVSGGGIGATAPPLAGGLDEINYKTTTTTTINSNNVIGIDFKEEEQTNGYHDENQKQSSNEESQLQGIRYFPSSVYLILSMEFCERFCFYGLRTVLYLYLTGYFDLDENDGTMYYHLFVMTAYCTPILGGILSDNYIGKFKTILYLSIIYVVGIIFLSVTSVPNITGDPPNAWGAIIGLILIAFGTGGIKPCVSSLGADQISAKHILQIQLFFSLFYFSINLGSVISTIVTPILRTNGCFGFTDCYPLAFGVPGMLMIIATIMFALGKNLYHIVPPSQNVFAKVCSCIFKAIIAKCTGTVPGNKVRLSEAAAQDKDLDDDLEEDSRASSSSSPHWLDVMKPLYGGEFVEDVKIFLRILLVLIPAPLFWTLFDQTASKWTQQASEMGMCLGSLCIAPDLMQVFNSFFVLLLIPVFEKFIYPLLRRRFAMTPLQRMGTGLILTVLSFVVAGFVQLQVNKGVFVEEPDNPDCKTCCQSNCVNIFVQVPQYLILTAGEIFFSITGLEFAYSQAPVSLKSVCAAFWLLTVAFGNLIVIIIAGTDFFQNRAIEFFFYAGLLFLVFFLFLFLARRYKYSDLHNN